MKHSRQNVFINSMLVFVSAFIITTIIHESGHFISYYLFGAHPYMYHNYVGVAELKLSITTKIVSAMAGPVISCIQGIIFGVIVLKKPDSTPKSLLFLWLSLLGFINFFGYLMLTPLSTVGDTGKVAELLNLSYIYRILVAVIGIITLIYLVIKIGRNFVNFIPRETGLPERRKYVNSLVLFPIIAGSAVNVLLAFPVPVILSVIYPATSSYAVMCAYGVILKTKRAPSLESIIENKISRFLIFLTLSAILLNRLLTMGVNSA
jgi:hypothetical protein